MDPLWFGIVPSAIFGFVLAYWLMKKKAADASSAAEVDRTRLDELKNRNAALETAVEHLKLQHEAETTLLKEGFERERNGLAERWEEKMQSQQNLSALELSAAKKSFEAEKETLLRKLEDCAEAGRLALEQKTEQYEESLRNQRRLSASELETKQTAFEAEKKVLTQSLQDVKAQFEHSLAEMEKNHQTRLALMKEEFKNLSDAILEEKTGKLREAGRKELEEVVTPLRQKMGEFRTAVEESKAKGIELNAALTAQLGKMMEETCRIGGEARQLVNALRGQQKTQGDWGEFILEEILQRSGLRPGVHYERQETIRDQDGQAVRHEENDRKMRPDVIVHYPDGKDVIIDSKVSLTAYMDYMNAENEEQRREACARHVRSVKNHVEELARKDYSGYLTRSGRETVDFVVMFIPNEGPFHLAMISDPVLWNTAFLRKVLIVSPVNLMALLKIIHIAWTRDEQNRNQQMILDTASEMLDRLYAFYQEFDKIGTALDNVSKQYESATHKLKQEGRNRSVVLSGEKLKRLGVRMTKAKDLPFRFRSPGELEEEDAAPALPPVGETMSEAEGSAETEPQTESGELL